VLYHRSFSLPAHEKLKALGLSPQWVKVDIFFQINRGERDQYRRLYVPYCAYAFPLEALQGMVAYIRNGGLLITNCGMALVDRNEDEQFNAAAGDYKLSAGDELTVVFGALPHRAAEFFSLVPELKGPLTERLTLNAPVPLTASGHIVTAVKGAVHISGTARASATGKTIPAPLVIVTRTGLGSCVYVTFCLGNIGSFPSDQVFENICGPDALAAFVYPSGDQ
jgi:hypothetical protein